jgi:hypothetical protein
MEININKGIGQIAIDLTGLNPGSYLLDLRIEKRYNTKFIKI